MIYYALLFALVLATWLWAPLRQLGAGTRLLAMGLTALLGLLPVGLLMALRGGWMDEYTLVHAQVIGGWVVGTMLVLIPLLVARDGVWLLARLLGKRRPRPGFPIAPMASVAHSTTVASCLLGLAGLIAAWGVLQGVRPPEVREQVLYLDHLPAPLDGLRVAVLADIHATPLNNARYVQTVVDRANAARPDLIVLPGDMADGDAQTGAANVAPLAHLRAPHGVWAAPGNHEYYSGYQAWSEVFQTLGFVYLENQSRIVTIRGQRVAISGVGDPAYGRLSRHNRNPQVAEGLPPDVGAVVAQARGADFHLLLAHQPKLARENARKGAHPGLQTVAQRNVTGVEAGAGAGKAVDLQISGHTHGGHVRGMDAWLVAPANDGFVRGAYRLGPMQLFVSSGAGLWAGFPVRLGVPAAIEVLVLRRSASAS